MKKYLLILLLSPCAAFGQNVFVTNPPTKAANVILRDTAGNYVDASGGGGGGGGGDFTIAAFNAAFGTAGTADSQVMSVQGISGGTALPISVATIPSHAVTNAGTFAVQVTSAPSTAVTNAGTFAVQNTTAAGENHIGEVGGKIVVVGGNFTRPSDTTAYASGDLVANSTTPGSVVPITVAAARINDGNGMIRRIRLTTSSTSVTLASFRVHFYKASPTVTNGDNGAWLSTESTYLGACDVTVDKAFSDGAKGIGVPNNGSEINFVANTGTQNIFALIEARAAYTPTSAEVFTLACEVIEN